MIQTPKINLIHGDCMDLLRKTPDNHYQLAVIDPPYGLGVKTMDGRGYAKKWRKFGSAESAAESYNIKKWDAEVPTDEYFAELFRVSQNQIIWGVNYFELPPYRCAIVWDKMQPCDNFADVEIAWTSFDRVACIYRNRNHGIFRDSKTIHPTQKPINLYKWILEKFAKPGDRILDTHGGSMSIAIACYDLGFDLDLTELDKDYYDAGVARFERHRAQGQLFHAPATQLPEQQKMF